MKNNIETQTLRKVTRMGVYGVAIMDNHILLTKKKPGGCYRGLLDLPGGGIEFGEGPEETLKREFYEEVAMSFDSMVWMANLVHNRDVMYVENPFSFHHLGQIYRVYNHYIVPNPTPEEEFAWYNLKTLDRDQLTPFTQYAVGASELPLLSDS